MTGKVIHALARLLEASYLDAAPTDEQRDLWREAAATARGEHDQLRAEVERLTRTYELNRYHTLRPGALSLREPGACVCGHQLRDHHGLMGVCSVETCPCNYGRASVPECGAHNQALTCNRPLGHTGEHHWHLRRPHVP